jgi:molybdenum cofactor cytidylyltransferase
VLAAGGSSRLGRPKQLLRLRGEPLLLRACRLARAVAGHNVIVVLGAESRRLRCLMRSRQPSLQIAHNAHWRDGMAGSIRAGLRQVPPVTDGLLILLVDQVKIEVADLERLVLRWRCCPGRPAAAAYPGRPGGVPAVIPRREFRALRSLTGDSGARQLFGTLARMNLVTMPAAALDIDTPQDAAHLLQ